MKRSYVVISGCLILSISILLLLFNINSLNKRKDFKNDSQSLVELLNTLSVNRIDPKKKTILVYFNSDCSFCQWEIKEISKNIHLFEGFEILLLSFEQKESALSFLAKHSLSEYYIDVNPDKITSTIIGGVPQTFIYKNDILIKHFKGEVKIELILEFLE